MDKETLKYVARSRLANKFNDTREWREKRWLETTSRPYSRLMSNKQDRKSIGEKVAMISKQAGRDEMDFIAQIYQLSREMPMFFNWVTSVINRKQDDDLLVQIHWKHDWVAPVWAEEVWFRQSKWAAIHMVHQSENDPTQIAYNRNIDNIKRDIQTRTKPGKYLTQFFSNVLSPDEIREWAEKQVAFASCKGELKFIENDDPEMWEHVYANGPRSCMANSDSVQVYAREGNGLRLAVIETREDNYTARAIVRNNPDGSPMGFVRIYGTEQRWSTKLQEALAALNYCDRVSLDGVKLAKIEAEFEDCRDGYMCPYLDGDAQYVLIKDDHLYVNDGDGIRATYTGGRIPSEDGVECEDCGDMTDEDETTYVESVGRTVCDHCLNNDYTYAYGYRYQEWYPNDDVIRCESDDEYYLEESANNHDIYQCRRTDDWFHMDDLMLCEWGDYEGDYIHTDYVVLDEVTEQYGCKDDATLINGNYVPNDYATTCHITGADIDSRFSVEIGLEARTHDKWGHRITLRHWITVGADSWTAELIRENFLLCGSLLVPRSYYGNEINNVEEPSNIEYGDDFAGERFEDLFVEEAEHLLAA